MLLTWIRPQCRTHIPEPPTRDGYEEIRKILAKFYFTRQQVSVCFGDPVKVNAAILAPRAPLVIMDEPTNALDPTMREALLEQVLLAKQRGQAVLFSSHILSEVETVCDRVAILRQGRLVHEEVIANLKQGRHVVAKFDRPHEPVPNLDGLTVLNDGESLVLEVTADLPALLDWLSKQPLRELRMEPLGLRGIYSRFHGAEP